MSNNSLGPANLFVECDKKSIDRRAPFLIRKFLNSKDTYEISTLSAMDRFPEEVRFIAYASLNQLHKVKAKAKRKSLKAQSVAIKNSLLENKETVQIHVDLAIPKLTPGASPVAAFRKELGVIKLVSTKDRLTLSLSNQNFPQIAPVNKPVVIKKKRQFKKRNVSTTPLAHGATSDSSTVVRAAGPIGKDFENFLASERSRYDSVAKERSIRFEE
jgi:hypothetical protein